ncbi:hypothetical protein [Micromonospora pattaloongensis]|uniref:hypothetical protein n=1 Tax=Micromonospora pattaloongensis TaxID=405436 RepID=UPI00111520AF|nr:hypothetical protein [Micromonospora pattaloongensis]
MRQDDEPPGPVLPAGAIDATLPGDDRDRPVDERPPRPGQTRAEMRAPTPGGEPGETGRGQSG